MFIIAEVSQPILGYDSLTYFEFDVDSSKRCLRQQSHIGIHGTVAECESPCITVLHANVEYANLLQEFPTMMEPLSYQPDTDHSVFYHIETTGPPVFARPRRLPPDKLRAAKAEFDSLLRDGIIQPSKLGDSSSYGA